MAQTPVTGINTYYIDINDNSNDYITTGSPVPGSGFSISTNYTIQHSTTTTTNNDLLLNGFTVGGNLYDFQFLADTVVFRRVNNAQATGERQIIQLAIESKSGNTYKLELSYVPSEAAALNSLTINRGADNAFANDGGPNSNNIERLDYLFNDKLRTTTPDNSGFIINERGGNDNFKIAAILSLDANGNPATYGNLVSASASDWWQSAITVNTLVMVKDEADANFRPSAEVGSQPLSSIFFSFTDLGIATGVEIHGYSLFANDVSISPQTLTDVSTFPTNTNSTDGGLDLIASGGAFSSDGNLTFGGVGADPECPVLSGFVFDKETDLMLTSYHAHIAKTDGQFVTWGEDMAADGTDATVLTPITKANGYNYSGVPLMFTLSTNTHGQAFLLTTFGLYSWGDSTEVVGVPIVNSKGFGPMQAPPGLLASEILDIKANSDVFFLLTKLGEVWVVGRNSSQLQTIATRTAALTAQQ
ncbi:MAG: hypothetical protein AAF960_08030 [Bacteroidota bacterium]